MDVVNGKQVLECGLVKIPVEKLEPTIDDFRTDEVKETFERWFNWPAENYAPDFIIIHPSIDYLIKTYKEKNTDIDVIVDSENRYMLSARIAILGQYVKDGS